MHGLSCDLPGPHAHRLMSPVRPADFIMPQIDSLAAVLVIIYPHQYQWTIALIQRTCGNYPHGGEISFPGGKLEEMEESRSAALREAQEELGLDPDSVEIVGKLSPIPTVATRYLVQPFVCVTETRPAWHPHPREVAHILEIPVSHFLNPNNRFQEIREINDLQVEIPFFKMANYKIWGVTAMILCELLQIARPLFVSRKQDSPDGEIYAT